MDEVQVSIERKMDQSAQALQASFHSQLQSSMKDFMQQLQALQGTGEKETNARPVEAESPGSRSAGSKRRSSGDTPIKDKTHKRRPLTRSRGKEYSEVDDSDLSVEATSETTSNMKNEKPGEVGASSGAP